MKKPIGVLLIVVFLLVAIYTDYRIGLSYKDNSEITANNEIIAIVNGTAEDAQGLPVLSGIPVKDAHELADAFISALNAGYDLTGVENAIDFWREAFDFEKIPVHSGGLYEVEYSDNVYQFDVIGKDDKGDVVSITVLLNLQDEEPRFFSPFTYYYPYARSAAEDYLQLLMNGDTKQLAKWLSVDGGPEPTSDFIHQAEMGLLKYSAYDLESARVTEIRFSNERKRFICSVEDINADTFEILLRYGDGLIMPERFD